MACQLVGGYLMEDGLARLGIRPVCQTCLKVTAITLRRSICHFKVGIVSEIEPIQVSCCRSCAQILSVQTVVSDAPYFITDLNPNSFSNSDYVRRRSHLCVSQ